MKRDAIAGFAGSGFAKNPIPKAMDATAASAIPRGDLRSLPATPRPSDRMIARLNPLALGALSIELRKTSLGQAGPGRLVD